MVRYGEEVFLGVVWVILVCAHTAWMRVDTGAAWY